MQARKPGSKGKNPSATQKTNVELVERIAHRNQRRLILGKKGYLGAASRSDTSSQPGAKRSRAQGKPPSTQQRPRQEEAQGKSHGIGESEKY
jgi:hypothetical protein